VTVIIKTLLFHAHPTLNDTTTAAPVLCREKPKRRLPGRTLAANG
jgi:hypothetical protein